jgi:hypothetical protein
MADDVIIGSGATTPLDVTVAADEIAGKKIQRVKVQHGVDGSAVDVSATDPLPVTGAISVTGTMPVSQALPVQAATATLANVAGSASSVTLQASNANRKGLTIVNDSTAILYVKFGSTASATSYTYYLAGSAAGVPATLELPAGMVYTGIVTGIWASATGNARVTELT